MDSISKNRGHVVSKAILLITVVLFGTIGMLGCSDDEDDDGANGAGAQLKTIAEIVSQDTSFTTLNTALQAANLDSTLDSPGPYTVFAPKDSAFANLPAGTLDTLLANPLTDLRSILLYHVAADSLTASQVIAATSIPTVQGASISVAVENGQVVLNGQVRVTATDIFASNGVIHVIDGVLIPPSPAP